MQLKGYIKSEFLKSVMVLTSGTFIAQVISYIATPFITRLFSPDEIGELGVFLKVAAFITAIATARYEFTLPLPKRDQHAFQLFRLSLRIATITLAISFLVGLIYWLFTETTTYNLTIVLLLVFTMFMMVFKNIGTYWAIRMKTFKLISYSSISAALTTNIIKVLAGVLSFGSIGLMVAAFFGSVAGAVFFVKDYFSNKVKLDYKVSKRKTKALASKYKDFPNINLPHMLVDHGKELITAFLIVGFFDQTVFGSYDHSFRMLKLPLLLIGMAMGQVFYKKCAALYNSQQPILPVLKKITFYLFLISIIPFGVIFLYGEPLFVFVFGDEWQLSGKISEVLAPWLMINFITSPVSIVPMVINRQKAFFWVSLVGAFIQIACFGLTPFLIKSDFINQIEMFFIISIILSVFMLIYLFYILHFTKLSDERNRT